MRINKYENHHDEWQDEYNLHKWLQNERKKLINTDPYYPDTYFYDDHAEDFATLHKMENKLRG